MTVPVIFISLGVFLLSWNIGRAILPIGVMFLRRHHIVRQNYAGQSIPTGYGTVLLFAFVVIYALLAPFYVINALTIGDEALFWAIGVASLWIGFLGWLDDTLGDNRAKGFKGHVQVLKHDGVVTTGLLKAIGGGLAALITALVTSDSAVEWLIHATTIALATNWLNLLDLRPGRAAKFYLFTVVILCMLATPQTFILLFLPVILLTAATLQADLSGQMMLGDSGANLLGMQMGIFAVVTLPLYGCVLVLILLLIGHIYAERRSISSLIERTDWLQRLDNWGRVQP